MWKTTLDNTSKLTIELRDVVSGGVNIWDFDYPSYYTGEEKAAFEQKVIDHYFFRQIGQETVGRWLHMFRAKVREIMPYYVQMYKTVEIMNNIEDPFGNVDIVETFEEHGDSQEITHNTAKLEDDTSTTTARSGEDEKTVKFSNTPQGSISNLDSYLTEATQENVNLGSSETVTNDGEANTTTDGKNDRTHSLSHTYTKKGNQGVNTYAHDMIEFRQAIINIDMMIINELNCLFLGIY